MLFNFLFLHAQQLGRVVGNQLLLGEGQLLELLRVGGGDLGASDTDRRRLQVVEGVLAGQGEDLGANTERGETGLDRHQVAGLLDRLDDGLDVEGLDGAQVDDLGLDAVLALELLSSNERLADAAGEGDDGEVLAGALNLGLSELKNLLGPAPRPQQLNTYRNDKVVALSLGAHLERKTVEKPVPNQSRSELCDRLFPTRSPKRKPGWGHEWQPSAVPWRPLRCKAQRP